MVHQHVVHASCRRTGQRPSRALIHLLGAALALCSLGGCLPPPDCWRAPRAQFAEAAPSSGDGLVPTDSLVWLRIDTGWAYTQCAAAAAVLTDLDTGLVALEEEVRIEAPGRLLVGWRPTQGLRPNADYEISWTASISDIDSRWANPITGLVAFHTADDETPAAPPPAPTPLSWWAEADQARLATQPWEYDDSLALWLDGGRFVLMKRGATPSGGLPEEAFRIGERGYVWSTETLPAGETLNVSFASLSLSGDLSAWSEPVSLPLPYPGYGAEGDWE